MPRIDVQSLKRPDSPAKRFSFGPDEVLVRALTNAQMMVVQDEVNRLHAEYCGIGNPGDDDFIKPSKFALVDGKAAEVSFRACQVATILFMAVFRDGSDEPCYTIDEYLQMFVIDELAEELVKAANWSASYRDPKQQGKDAK